MEKYEFPVNSDSLPFITRIFYKALKDLCHHAKNQKNLMSGFWKKLLQTEERTDERTENSEFNSEAGDPKIG